MDGSGFSRTTREAPPPQAKSAASPNPLTGRAVHVAARGRPDHLVQRPPVGGEGRHVDDLLDAVDRLHAARHHDVGVLVEHRADALGDGGEVAPLDQGAEQGDGVGREPKDKLLVSVHPGPPSENKG